MTAPGQPVDPIAAFWAWFRTKEGVFADVVRKHGDIQAEVFNPINRQMASYREGIFLLIGMQGEEVDLIFTAEGDVRNFVFVEQLVDAAPQIPGWIFQALKPAAPIEKFGVSMNGYAIDATNLFFYAEEDPNLPDLIDIRVVYTHLKPENREDCIPGVFIFLENYLGELRFATDVDEVEVIGPDEAKEDLIPISKLSDYLIWRQKEFVEKHEGHRRDMEDDSYSIMEATLPDGVRIMAVLNTDLLNWDAKVSHPWMLVVTIKYDGSKFNGMPSEDTLETLNHVMDVFEERLVAEDGYLSIVRQTGNNERLLYIACKDFRKPSLVATDIIGEYAGVLDMSYRIFSDKYWLGVERFRP
ncbi:MAG: DUF695 domain-containing protein [Bacteroidia bacterium]